jgi:hypothetical protein
MRACPSLQLCRQLRDQPRQRLAQAGAVSQPDGLLPEGFEVPVNGGFRAGIAEFDTYCIDGGMLAPGDQRLLSLLNLRFADAGPGHAVSDIS